MASWEERKAAIRQKARARYEKRLGAGELGERDFVWCLHCGRVWFRRNRDTWCPGEGCDGGGPGDLWAWSSAREGHVGWPEVPVPGEVYLQ